MSDEEVVKKRQMEDKIRCAKFLLEMINKYGASIKEEMKTNQLTKID